MNVLYSSWPFCKWMIWFNNHIISTCKQIVQFLSITFIITNYFLISFRFTRNLISCRHIYIRLWNIFLKNRKNSAGNCNRRNLTSVFAFVVSLRHFSTYLRILRNWYPKSSSYSEFHIHKNEKLAAKMLAKVTVFSNPENHGIGEI